MDFRNMLLAAAGRAGGMAGWLAAVARTGLRLFGGVFAVLVLASAYFVGAVSKLVSAVRPRVSYLGGSVARPFRNLFSGRIGRAATLLIVSIAILATTGLLTSGYAPAWIGALQASLRRNIFFGPIFFPATPPEWKDRVTVILGLIGLPVLFLLWHWRDRNVRDGIENSRKDINLKEFQEVQLRASGALAETLPAEAREQLQIAALHQIRGFARGEYGETFRRPAAELLLAGHAAAMTRIGHREAIGAWLDGTPGPAKIFSNIRASLTKARANLSSVDRERLGILRDERAFVFANGLPLNGRRLDLIDTYNQLSGDEIDLSKLRKRIFPKAADLSGTTLIGVNLIGADLRTINFTMAHLEGANLGWARLDETILNHAHLEGALLREAHLRKAVLWGAVLDGAWLYNAELPGADLSYARLRGCDASRARFVGKVDLSRADFHGATLDDADFAGAILSWTNFEGANLTNAKLVDVDLNGGLFRNSWLAGATLVGSMDGARFENCWFDDRTWLSDTERPPHDASEITPEQRAVIRGTLIALGARPIDETMPFRTWSDRRFQADVDA